MPFFLLSSSTSLEVLFEQIYSVPKGYMKCFKVKCAIRNWDRELLPVKFLAFCCGMAQGDMSLLKTPD